MRSSRVFSKPCTSIHATTGVWSESTTSLLRYDCLEMLTRISFFVLCGELAVDTRQRARNVSDTETAFKEMGRVHIELRSMKPPRAAAFRRFRSRRATYNTRRNRNSAAYAQHAKLLDLRRTERHREKKAHILVNGERGRFRDSVEVSDFCLPATELGVFRERHLHVS